MQVTAMGFFDHVQLLTSLVQCHPFHQRRVGIYHREGEVQHLPHDGEEGDVQKVCKEMLIENYFLR